MPRLLKDETSVSLWKNFLEDHYKGGIENIALDFPHTRSLYINYELLDKQQPALSEKLIKEPYKTIFNAEEATKEIDTAVGKIAPHIRIQNLPDVCKKPIRDLRSIDMGKLVAIEGLVKRDTRVKANLVIATFQCLKCGATIRITQDGDILDEPSECYEDQGGCGRTTTWKLLTSLSQFIDGQKIEMQENPEGLQGTEQPATIPIYLNDDLVGKISPGDRILINGILNGMQQRRGPVKLKTFDFYVDAVAIDIRESLYTEVEVTEEDEKEIKKAASDPEIYDKMIQSIAPAIYGMVQIKEGLLLQQFGGVRKTLIDGTSIRGDIHVLLIGDPGTAKSQLIKSMYRTAPRGILAAGGSSTKAGLTATAVKDDFSEGQWVLEAGALVLADGGLACIDEFDKMSNDDRGSIHQAMEQQEISVAKAGINATLKSRCSILAAANPKLGRFDEYKPIHEQIDMPPALFSRFDLIFPIIDRPNIKVDTELAGHVLRSHQDPDSIQLKPFFSPDFIKKYVAYAKHNVKPRLTDNAKQLIQQHYVSCRSANEGIHFTPRQLEGFVRLAEASARVRLSDEITGEDTKRVIRIVDQYLKGVSLDRETGNIDTNIIETGISLQQGKRIRMIRDIIQRLSNNSSDGGSNQDDIITEAEIQGIKAVDAEKIIERLKYDGSITIIGHGKVRLNEF